ncbi:MAG TPA: HEAT repeat domain-containing protein [Blastocatellia bacterium]|nr:HEAT repeat domain-containing protein [Blastocatellia bacterium]
MRKSVSIAAMVLALLIIPGRTTAQRETFTTIDGPSLGSRMDRALRLGGASKTRFWTAYQFDLRSGICIDNDSNGTRINDNKTPCETPNAGVFLLRDPGSSAVLKVEVYNLDRRRSFEGLPVYWLGKATGQESLDLLRGIATSDADLQSIEHTVMAISFHDDVRAASILEDLIRTSTNHRVRTKTVFWLGQTPGHHPLLEELARNEQENLEVRKQAVFVIGISQDPAAMSTLEGLYGAVTAREVKRQVVFAAFINHSSDESVEFLIRRAESDPDPELKKQALFWIGQKAGQRSMEILGKTVDSSDVDTDVQVQAVFAISRRPKEESIPTLIRLARTHPKGEIRKQALFWLGQSGDERALQVFKEILGR